MDLPPTKSQIAPDVVERETDGPPRSSTRERMDAVRAARVAAQQMLFARDLHRFAERRTEHLELTAAQPLAGGRSSADRTVVLDEDQVAAVLDHLGEISLLGSACRQRTHPNGDGVVGQRVAVRIELL